MIREKHLAALIQQIADEKGWSGREVARRCELPYATVQKIMWNEGTKTPRTETLEALAKGLGVPLTMLMDAAAADTGLRPMSVPDDADIAITLRAMNELPADRRREIAALARAMLATYRGD